MYCVSVFYMMLSSEHVLFATAGFLVYKLLGSAFVSLFEIFDCSVLRAYFVNSILKLYISLQLQGVLVLYFWCASSGVGSLH